MYKKAARRAAIFLVWYKYEYCVWIETAKKTIQRLIILICKKEFATIMYIYKEKRKYLF